MLRSRKLSGVSTHQGTFNKTPHSDRHKRLPCQASTDFPAIPPRRSRMSARSACRLRYNILIRRWGDSQNHPRVSRKMNSDVQHHSCIGAIGLAIPPRSSTYALWTEQSLLSLKQKKRNPRILSIVPSSRSIAALYFLGNVKAPQGTRSLQMTTAGLYPASIRFM